MSGVGFTPSAAQKAEDARVLQEIVDRLNADVDTLVPRLLPNAVRDGKYWSVGDLDGRKGQSLKINRTGNIGWWKDFSADGPQSSGDMLKLYAHVVHKGQLGPAIKELKASMGLVNLTRAQLDAIDREAKRRAAEQKQRADLDDDGKRQRAAALWHGSPKEPTPHIKGTPGQAYLECRGINFARLGHIPGSLRYRPDVWCPVRRGRFPAMIACIMALDGSLAAVHRTWLDIDDWSHATKSGPVRVVKVGARGIGDDFVKRIIPHGAPLLPGEKVKSFKLTLGSYAGGCIPLWKGKHRQLLRDIPAGTRVCVSEGIEDGLSWALAHPQDRVVAGVSLSNIGGLMLPAQAGALCIIGQNDPADSKAAAALERGIKRQQEAGRQVEYVFPPEGFKDFNDFLMGRSLANG